MEITAEVTNGQARYTVTTTETKTITTSENMTISDVEEDIVAIEAELAEIQAALDEKRVLLAQLQAVKL